MTEHEERARVLRQARDQPGQRSGHGEVGDAEVLQALAEALAQTVARNLAVEAGVPVMPATPPFSGTV